MSIEEIKKLKITNVRYNYKTGNIDIKVYNDAEMYSYPFTKTFFVKSEFFKSTPGVFNVEKINKVHYLTKQAVDRVSIIDRNKNSLFDHICKNKRLVDNFYQYDLHPEYQFLIYNNILFSDKYKVAYLDIETNDDINADSAASEIDLITIVTDDDIKTFDRRNFASEKSMLIQFFRYIKKVFPDIILGWNVVDFDRKYIVNRSSLLGVNPNSCNFEMIQFINGSDVLMKMYGYSILKDTGGMSLDKVSRYFLNEGKIDTCGLTPGVLYRKDPDRAIEYNINDCILVKKLNDKLKFVKFLVNIQNISGCLLRNSFFNSMVIENMILRKYDNYVFPSRFDNNVDTKYEGGYVIKPPEGIFDNVAVFDFSSLYPSIFLTFNISPDTKDMKNYDYYIDGVGFKKTPHGIFKQTAKFLYDERLRLKNDLKSLDKDSDEYINTNVLQLAFKTILNSIYGVCGFNKFRLYDVDIAKSITSMGRKLIKELKVRVEADNIGEVIYGDTDSSFIKVKIDPEEIENRINNIYLPEYVEKFGVEDNYLAVEKEKVFEWLMLFGKKKLYIGRQYGDNEFIIKGHSLIKYDVPKSIRIMMKEIITDISNNKQINLNNYFIRLKNIPDKELIILKKLNKDKNSYVVEPQHLTALEYSRKNLSLSDESYRNKIVRMVYASVRGSEQFPDTNIIAVNEDFNIVPNDFTLDYDKYFVFFFLKKMYDVYKIYGFSRICGIYSYLKNELKSKDPRYDRVHNLILKSLEKVKESNNKKRIKTTITDYKNNIINYYISRLWKIIN